ncbi:g574 [Coccomyxa viridis]|uniref:G574 protein n=1 Tax=Coccomyxa viridis TaxID=1274662 RepID=A0ABP1FG13_9CHLO
MIAAEAGTTGTAVETTTAVAVAGTEMAGGMTAMAGGTAGRVSASVCADEHSMRPDIILQPSLGSRRQDW